MLGAFSKVTGIVSINNIINAIGEMTNKKVNENVGAAKEAYNHVLS
jgi:Pyruvate/2-oxoacid:ferredoxin oxidoreductase gamma subunit